MFAQVTAPGARTGLTGEQPKRMARHVVHTPARRHVARGVFRQPVRHCFLTRRRAATQKGLLEFSQHIGPVVSLAAQHGAVDMRQVFCHVRHRLQAAIDDNEAVGESTLHPPHLGMTQRRNLAVFLGAEAAENGLSRVHDEMATTRCIHSREERFQKLPVVAVIDAEATLHCHRHVRRHGSPHGRHAFRHHFRPLHQAGPESAIANAVTRATAVQVDLVVAVVGADTGRGRQFLRVAAT